MSKKKILERLRALEADIAALRRELDAVKAELAAAKQPFIPWSPRPWTPEPPCQGFVLPGEAVPCVTRI